MKNLKEYENPLPNEKIFVEYHLELTPDGNAKIKTQRPAHTTPPTPTPEPILAADPEEVNTLPTGPGMALCTQSIIYAGQMDKLAARIEKGNKRKTTKHKQGKEGHQIIVETPTKSGEKQILHVSLDNPETIAKSGPNFLKLFLYACNLINKQAAYDGEIKHDIEINLNDIVRDGVFTNYKNAWRAVTNTAPMLTCIKIQGQIYKGKELIRQKTAVMFPTIDDQIEKGVLKIEVNKNLNYDFLAIGYAAFPKTLYRLKGRPLTLAFYVMYMARQNCRKIRDTGSFNISVKAAHDYMNLPDLEETKDPRRDIVNAIVNSIREIEETEPDIDIDLCKTGKESPKEFLQGYLNIVFKGTLYKYHCDLADDRTEIIQENTRRAKAREDKARAINRAKEIAEEKKAEKKKTEKAATDPTTESQ